MLWNDILSYPAVFEDKKGQEKTTLFLIIFIF